MQKLFRVEEPFLFPLSLDFGCTTVKSLYICLSHFEHKVFLSLWTRDSTTFFLQLVSLLITLGATNAILFDDIELCLLDNELPLLLTDRRFTSCFTKASQSDDTLPLWGLQVAIEFCTYWILSTSPNHEKRRENTSMLM